MGANVSGPFAAAAAAMIVVVLGCRAAAALAPTRLDDSRRSPRSIRFGRHRRTRTRAPSDIDVANWCDQMARALRSGSSLTMAFRDNTFEHPAMAPIVDPMAAQVARGRSLSHVLADACDPSTASGLALTVVRTCAELGGPAASPLERVAATLRARDAIRQEQRAHSAQAQMSARVLTLVPIGMLVLLAATDPNVRSAVRTPAGVAAVALGAALNVSGWWWMQRIIGRPR